MRTTLDLDPDVLQAAKEIAAARGSTAGRVISDLVRKALEPSVATTDVRNGSLVGSERFADRSDAVPADLGPGHRQVTDVYLAGLAHARGGKLVTFDGTVLWSAVKGAKPSLIEVLSAIDE